MQTKVVRIDDVEKCAPFLDAAGEVLQAGGLVAFPTETVYGLGANGFDGEACAAIYRAKGRPSDNPLILHVSDRGMVDLAVKEVPPMAEKLMAAFCPGPITLIMEKAEKVPECITGGLQTVGIRMPDHDVARAMIKAAGVPIAAPSANLSGRPSPTTAEAVRIDLNGRVPMILDGGACAFGVESTIVDCTGDTAVILRPGAITREMLTEVLGKVELDPALVGADVVPRAPGMKYRHYAPIAPMTLMEGDASGMAEAFLCQVKKLHEEGKAVGIIASHEVLEVLREIVPENLMADYGAQGDLPRIAANIYEALRSFDTKKADCLLAEGTTEEGLGLAIMNRLHKASGFQSIHI